MKIMENKKLQEGNVLIVFPLVVIIIFVVILSMKFLNVGPFSMPPPASVSSSISQDQVVNDSDGLKDIESDLGNANVLGVNTELETIQNELKSF